MAYESKRLGRQKVRYDDANDDNPLVYQLYVGGAKVTPTAATIQINDPSGTELLAATATGVSISGTLISYALDTTTEADWPIDTGYKATLSVTYNSITYPAHFMFDVVRHLLRIDVGVDQLRALDPVLVGDDWNGDEDFSEVILAVRDIAQAKFEVKMLEGKPLNEAEIIDSSAIAIAQRYLILAQVARATEHEEKTTQYQEMGDHLLAAVLSTMRFDDAQGGTEPEQYGGLQGVRLVT
jgi:hypothetical protein